MLCMTCGDEMISGEVIPADAGLVRGFENITLRCPACGDTESRFVFVGTSGVNRVAETAKAKPHSHNRCSSNGAPDAVTSQENKSVTLAAEKELSTAGCQTHSTAGIPEKITGPSKPRITQGTTPIRMPGASAQSWGRAVERLRIHQADLQQRADKAKRESLLIEFDQAWDELSAAQHAKRRTAKPRDNSHAKQGRTFAVTRPRGSARIMGADREAVCAFDGLWDSVVRGPDGFAKPPEVSVAASLAPLPRSLSLAVLEPNTTRNVLPQKSAAKRKLEKLFTSLRDALR
jgi:hypothetical protein